MSAARARGRGRRGAFCLPRARAHSANSSPIAAVRFSRYPITLGSRFTLAKEAHGLKKRGSSTGMLCHQKSDSCGRGSEEKAS